MFINNASILTNSWLQLKWKLAAYRQKILTLIILQLFFGLLIVQSSQGMNTTIGIYIVDIQTYDLTGYAVIGAIILFIFSALIGSKSELKENMIIPTTRMTATISNSMYLLILSFISGVLSFCNIYIAVALLTLLSKDTWYVDITTIFSISHFVGLWCFFWMITMIGYFLASITQIKWWLGVGAFLLIVLLIEQFIQLEKISEWFIEGGIWAFSGKCLVITVLAKVLSLICTRKLEVED